MLAGRPAPNQTGVWRSRDASGSDPRMPLRWPRMRALIVTNLYPTEEQPRLGRFVRDQVEALRTGGTEVELFTFPLGAREYLPAARRLRRSLREASFDVVHAHYGLCGWVAALAGARPLVVTFHGTDIRHRVVGPSSRMLARRIDVVAGASRSAFEREAGRRGLPEEKHLTAVLPCGIDLERFRSLPREEAREKLGLRADGRYLLFPADPGRPVKRHDRARAVAELGDAELLVTREVPPEEMPLWVNASSGVLITSDSEGFGLAILEALACGVPVASTPVGVAPFVAAGLSECLVEPFEPHRWATWARRHLGAADPRVDGRGRAEAFSAERMAERVRVAYEEVSGGVA
jgi:teichuronic acid biosynthesis glycosyltransferase TuaC